MVQVHCSVVEILSICKVKLLAPCILLPVFGGSSERHPDSPAHWMYVWWLHLNQWSTQEKNNSGFIEAAHVTRFRTSHSDQQRRNNKCLLLAHCNAFTQIHYSIKYVSSWKGESFL